MAIWTDPPDRLPNEHIDAYVERMQAHSQTLPVADWDDPRTQQVYRIMCSGNPTPTDAEHWEGWQSRLIVAALFPESARAWEPPELDDEPDVENDG